MVKKRLEEEEEEVRVEKWKGERCREREKRNKGDNREEETGEIQKAAGDGEDEELRRAILEERMDREDKREEVRKKKKGEE